MLKLHKDLKEGIFGDYKANGQIEMEQWEVYVGEWWRGNDKFHREQVLLDYFILCDV